MLLAIDAGNTQTVYGLWNGSEWTQTWRCSTQRDDTEDQLAAWLKLMFDLADLPFEVDLVVVASVVPTLDSSLQRLADKWFGKRALFLRTGDQVGLTVEYEPPHAVGADRIANCLAAIEVAELPLIVVDFGTATTFDVLDKRGVYVGGAIMTGVQVSADALTQRTAKLPQVELVRPLSAIGTTTVQALQSGIMLGYAGAVERIIEEIGRELGEAVTVLATGGLGEIFQQMCPSVRSFHPLLTLDGLRQAAEKLQKLPSL